MLTVGEVLAGVLLRSDAQAGADELFAEVADAAGDAVVAGGGTSQGEAELTGLERDIVMQDDELVELDPVKPEEGRQRRPAVVHEGERLDQMDGGTSERDLRDRGRGEAHRRSARDHGVDPDPALRALAAKVRYVVDPTNPYPKQFTGHLRVTLKDGSVMETRQGYFKGGADHPLSDADLQTKFFANCLHGGLRGFDKVLWKGTPLKDAAVQFTYTSPDGKKFRRLASVAFNLEDPAELVTFLKGDTRTISVSYSDAMVELGPWSRCPS